MDCTLIVARILTVSVMTCLIGWLIRHLMNIAMAAKRKMMVPFWFLSISGVILCCRWLAINLAYMADMAKQNVAFLHSYRSPRVESMLFVQRILSLLITVLFFRWLIRYFMHVATMTKQVMSDTEEEREMTKREQLIVCLGEMLIDFVPNVAGESLAETSGFIQAPGGAPANVAVAVARLGGNSAFIGKLGEDEFGRMLVSILEANGVNREGVRFDPEAKTALAFVTLKKNGEREFMFYRNPSADVLLKESELDLGLIRRANILHYGSISLISEPCRGAHMAAMKAAREAGLLLSYDPNVRLPLWPSPAAARSGIMSIWNQADFIKVSHEEVAFLTEKDPYDEDAVTSLWFDGLKLLVVTDGEKGCRYLTKDFRGKVNGFPVATVDATGAGDAFVGALLLSLAKDNSLFQDEEKLREALIFANACGALSTTQKGVIPALPTASMALELVYNKSKQP